MGRSKPRLGRPPRAGQTASERIELRVTPTERKAWARMAKRHECDSISDWIRGLCNYEVSQHE
jgi:hypothetical protein